MREVDTFAKEGGPEGWFPPVLVLCAQPRLSAYGRNIMKARMGRVGVGGCEAPKRRQASGGRAD